jgi:transcription-repair coupling factor (superfamily II helicase)
MEYNYKGLIEPVSKIKGFDSFIEKLKAKQSGKVIGTVDAQKAHMIYTMAYYTKQTPVIITKDEVSAKKLFEDIKLLYGEDKVYLYPERDILFYNADVHSMDITAKRMEIIEAILKDPSSLLIIPSKALLNPLSPKETWLSTRKVIQEGQTIDLEKWLKELIQMGYERVSKVEGIGQFSVRGGIIDLFIPIYTVPHRIELWDDEIDSIREFNLQTQRSIDKKKEIYITPNQEVLFTTNILEKAIPTILEELSKTTARLKAEGKKQSAKTLEEQVKEDISQIREGMLSKKLELYIPYTTLQTVSIMDYLDKNCMLYIDEPKKVQEQCMRTFWEYEESMKDRLEYGHILPKQIDYIFSYEQAWYKMTEWNKVLLMNFESAVEGIDIKNTLNIRVFENNNFYKNFDLLYKDLCKWKKENKKIVLLAGLKPKADRIIEALEEQGIIATYSEKLNNPLEQGQIIVTKGSLEKGFAYEDIDLYVVSDKDLFGQEKKKTATKKKYKGKKIQSFLELTPGDYVVHENHGIGIFKGVEQITIENMNKDNLKIEYADGVTLYVSIDQMDRIQKYVGAEGKGPKLSKLGKEEWKKSKAKVKAAVQDMAKELIALYSVRESSRGFVYETDTLWQQEFEELFPYAETDDQLEAIIDVKKDMESEKIMDRLICGDVGYGKTEVAIRAAFKAVQNNKQVAYLVPTTILAQQHYNRFVERMANYPIEIGLLSRFRTPKQTKQTLEGLKKGSVDIVIGTHRLLSKDVKFKDLGLVIIDEEQRFGVAHKEKLKEMRTEVDVMTLTATPIPRTLHMSLVGIRDMSLLEDAPLERRPVQTYVIEYSEDFIKDAIHRELARDGQVYFLYNQVKDIEEKALHIQKLVPGAKVSYAHGQMSERELEKIMFDFIEGEINVLVCTTIIETGLDIGNANTIIINDADKMGLSQLYQLRGRVGRSSRTSYAYLMYKKDKVLKEIAEKRLQAIKQFTQLGAGFKIAMRDLEIRGAGNLLGAKQHGHMEAVGYDLYSKMLQEAVSLEKGEIMKEDFETAIEIKISAYIPREYIEDEKQKLDIYKKIASIQSQKDYNDIQEEIEDRYGEIPDSVQNLLDIAWIKWEANQLDIILVTHSPNEIMFRFKDNAALDASKIPTWLKEQGKEFKFLGGKESVLKVQTQKLASKDCIHYIKNTLQAIKKLKS